MSAIWMRFVAEPVRPPIGRYDAINGISSSIPFRGRLAVVVG